MLPEEFSEWEGRIVGGSNAGSGQFPYQVSLRSAANGHFCGGSIISNRYALSAAHCTIGRTTANTRVVVGTHLLNSGGVSHMVQRIVNHGQYNANTLANDVSLVQTQTNIVYNNLVQPIGLGSVFVGGGVGVAASGWGQTSVSFPAYLSYFGITNLNFSPFILQNPGGAPNNLQFANLQTLTNADCRNRFSVANANRVFDNTICTFTRNGQGMCMGDSGGPIATGGNVVGIVSWGIACAVGSPDVFARVSSHRTWILNNAV